MQLFCAILMLLTGLICLWVSIYGYGRAHKNSGTGAVGEAVAATFIFIGAILQFIGAGWEFFR